MYLSRVLLDNLDSRVSKTLADVGNLHRIVMRGHGTWEVKSRVLFRLEPEPRGSNSVLLVQGPVRPDWSFLREERLCADAHSKNLALQFDPGQKLRFRLRANPTVKREGKRHGHLREEDVRLWWRRKSEQHGFLTSEGWVDVRSEGTLRAFRSHNVPATFRSWLLQGTLEIQDPASMKEAVERGIGSGKAFGFGLLSLAPM